ncbi:MAG TPA: polyphosphate kinase 2 family protein [Bryobacteraceae bacterium]|jgi:PPK2 family polyphosphate:nucleotide phosphotransferase|nr:polyphosphate kinase 2 family protein [Bryobacteraceae bacterium]
MSKIQKLAARYRIDNGKKFRLKDFDPADTGSIASEDEAKDLLQQGLERLRDGQEKLHAQEEWAVLLILQGMDAGGKDSLIKHVMSGVNPTGCEVFSFKQPSDEELRHDFLWRSNVRLPERGRIGIFNRSYYEEVLVVRVHPAVLANEKLPKPLANDKKIWKHRFEDICAYERYLARNGTAIRKFFLNLSLEEQKKRFLARLDTPSKNWKFSESDVEERRFWPEYCDAYEQAIRHTATPDAPWYIVPADHKWFTQLVVAAAIVDTLDELGLAYPKVTGQKRKELDAARKALEAEKS